MAIINLALILHNHQPVGNFDAVFEQAYREAYAPFLDILARHPGVRLGLHTSGPLLEWLEEHRPEYPARLRELVAAGQVEPIGGAHYEPILTMLPPRDRVGQIRAFTEHLQGLFPGRVRGMWLAERVWEQALACDLAEAGIEFTALDDFHFKAAGLTDRQLLGSYLTEDRGRTLRVFPGSERLRYLIPFGTVEENLDYLRSVASEDGRALVVYADDGEKFGVWPQTHRHVYTKGWLERFFKALEANASWIRILTPSECLDRLEPLGRVYLPDCSYREMTEWALPADRQADYEHALHQLEKSDQAAALRPFLRGGTWRNFKVKYSEANWMYGRMLQVSDAVNRFEGDPAVAFEARRALYRAQCNCPYWHGVFGGLYLPHLREATYGNLIAAQAALDHAANGRGPWARLRHRDINLDGADDVELANARLAAVLTPNRGGHLVQLDLVPWRTNLLATLTRRREAYHQRLQAAVASQTVILAADAEKADQVQSIHDLVRVKEHGLEKRLEPDRLERESLIDHLFAPETSLASVMHGTYSELGTFATGRYDCEAVEQAEPGRPDRVEQVLARMRAVGRVNAAPRPRALHLEKYVRLRADAPGLTVDYTLLNPTAWPVEVRFGVEFNFAMLAGSAHDRYYRLGRQRLGTFATEADLSDVVQLDLVDEWRDLCVRLDADVAAGLWLYPVETVSLSEAGYERVYQASCVIPHWRVEIAPEGDWRVRLSLAALPANG